MKTSASFENRVVAITGAGKGLGRAYARSFARLGARVIVNNRTHDGVSPHSADQVVEEIVAEGGVAIANYDAVESPGAGDRLLGDALSAFGQLDCLVANAGVSENRRFAKQSLAEVRNVIEVNLMGTINVVHPVFRHMCERQSGAVVLSTSSAGLFGGLGLPAYSASKAGLLGLMKSLSIEGRSKSVWVNAIAPYAATNMTVGHMSGKLEEVLDPDAVASVVAWLASRESGGETIIAGGGRIARAQTLATRPEYVDEGDLDEWLKKSGQFVKVYDDAVEHFEEFVEGLDRVE